MTPAESQAQPNPGGHICDRQGHALYQDGDWIKCSNCTYKIPNRRR